MTTLYENLSNEVTYKRTASKS